MYRGRFWVNETLKLEKLTFLVKENRG